MHGRKDVEGFLTGRSECSGVQISTRRCFTCTTMLVGLFKADETRLLCLVVRPFDTVASDCLCLVYVRDTAKSPAAVADAVRPPPSVCLFVCPLSSVRGRTTG